MRNLLALAVLGVLGCGGTTSPEGALVGTWVFDPGGDSLAGVTFNSDQSYVLQFVTLTSAASADDEIEGGVFAADGTTLTLTPRKSSCPGPAPIQSLMYDVSGDSLTLINGATAIIFVRQAQSGGAPVSGTITSGCSDGAGHFTPAPVVPVGN